MRKRLGRSTDLVQPGDPPQPDGALIFDRTFPSNEHAKGEVLEQLLKVLAGSVTFPDPSEAVNMRLVLDEALVNAVTHGNKSDPKRNVRVRCWLATQRVAFLVEDEGAGFREEDLPDPDAPENLLEESGRGVILIRSMMQSASYWRGGSALLMSKALHTPPLEKGGQGGSKGAGDSIANESAHT